MIPLRDENPSGSKPVVTYVIIAACVAVFLIELLQGERLESFIATYGVVPLKYTPQNARQFSLFGGLLLPVFTCMFLHGGVVHLLGNMWYLWIFGDNVEDQLGHLKFLLFYLGTGVAATMVHILFNIDSRMPVVGASGAIAGVLGGYLVSYPRARVLVLLPLWIYWPIVPMPAFFVLGMWFFLQLGNGMLAIGASAETVGGVAWWAHIGGFVAGVLLIKMLPKRKRRLRRPTRYDRPYHVDMRW